MAEEQKTYKCSEVKKTCYYSKYSVTDEDANQKLMTSINRKEDLFQRGD